MEEAERYLDVSAENFGRATWVGKAPAWRGSKQQARVLPPAWRILPWLSISPAAGPKLRDEFT